MQVKRLFLLAFLQVVHQICCLILSALSPDIIVKLEALSQA